MTIARVKNDSVWQSLRILFIGSTLIFLINVFFGFDNALTVGDIPRWQILIHLHGGSIGWITLSAIGVNIWLHTGQREVSANYERWIRRLVWAAVIIFGGYVPSFGLAFQNLQGPLRVLLPIFGSGAVLMLWTSAIYALTQLKNDDVVSTAHLLVSSALLVAAIGATVGMLLGLEYALGRQFLPLPEGDRTGAHAFMMDIYLFLIGTGIIEWFMTGANTRRSIWGLLQTLIWAVSAVLAPVGYFLNVLDAVLPIYLLGLLIGFIIFMVRMGWRALAQGIGKGRYATISFLGTAWLIVFIAIFLYVLVIFATTGDIAAVPPTVAGIIFVLGVHAAFVGMMTNLLLGVQAARGQSASQLLSWGDPAAFWTINLGILIFATLKGVMDSRYGAMVMGVGVLLGLFTMFMRMRASD